MEIEKQNNNQMELELGDIIEIVSPSNPKLHQKHFYIDYIDENIVEVINISSGEKLELNKENNMLNDESITAVYLLNRSDDKGYAKQNNLTLYTWVDVHIGGNEPMYIIGKITNVEEDCIEITATHPTSGIIYIDFEYKGIPKNIPIKTITIREPLETDEKEQTGEKEESKEDDTPDSDIIDVLREQYIEGNGIVFAEDLDDIKQLVEIPEHKKTYALGIQLNDLLDEFLSTIPNIARTNEKMKQIHILIERYKQLRNNFSLFDENENVTNYIKKGALYKPLLEKLKDMNYSNKWIIPVVTNNKKFYIDKIDEDEDDIITEKINFETDLEEMNDIINNTDNNNDVYTSVYKRLNSLFTPYTLNTACNNCIVEEIKTFSDFDSIIDNDGKFGSLTCNLSKGNPDYVTENFVTQRHITGIEKPISVFSKSGSVSYKKEKITNDDIYSLKSIMMAPYEYINKSKMFLPSTNIKHKVELNEINLKPSDFINNLSVESQIIDNLDNKNPIIDEESEEDNEFFTNTTNYVLDDSLQETNDKYEKFLDIIIPKTKYLFQNIKNKIENKYSLVNIVKELECFGIYPDDISYKQYDNMRYFIKQEVAYLNKQLLENKNKFNGLKMFNYNDEQMLNIIEKILFDNEEISEEFYDGYKLDKEVKFTTSELLTHLRESDFSNFFYTLIYYISFKKLITPDELIPSFEPAKIDDTDYQVEGKNCLKRYLAKKYDSITNLQQDNGQEIFYDEEYDDTPYYLKDLYKKEEKEMEPEKFKAFLIENLRSKHMTNIEEVDPEYLSKLAETMISKKKKVDEGSYAILSKKPKLPDGLKLDDLSSDEKDQVKIEEEVREKITYYVRVKDQWVQDNDINEENFFDNNTLFCNIQENCLKNNENKTCESKQMSKIRLSDLQKSRMTKEYENRVNYSLEQIGEMVRKSLANLKKHNIKKNILNEIALYRYNNYSYYLGMNGSVIEDLVVSPHTNLMNKILGQDDFVKKQYDILKFIDLVCREPMYDVEIDEHKYWYYCKASNTKILPKFYGILAQSYFDGNYYDVLNVIKSRFGKLSDDGDSIVDIHSGFEIVKREFVNMDEYTEEGFKVITNEVIEKDILEKLGDLVYDDEEPIDNNDIQPELPLIFENEESQKIYNVSKTLCDEIGIPVNEVKDYVLQNTFNNMEKYIEIRSKYEKTAALKLEKKNITSIPYDVYKNRMMFWFLSCSLLVAIQTKMPSFESRNARKLDGYPLTGIEDESSLNYLSEILYKFKNKIEPWNAIEKIKKQTIKDKIKEVLDKFYLSRNDIENLYKQKREYLIENPQKIYSKEHNVQKWSGFLPPIVRFEISVRNIGDVFNKDFLNLLKTGHRDQHQNIGVYQSKIMSHGYNIIQMINGIVKSKPPLLNTASKEPFLENSCCNNNSLTSIEYFEKENSQISENIISIRKLSSTLQDVKEHGRASLLHHNENTRILYSQVNDVIDEELIYDTIIHYNNLRNDMPIPQNLIYMFSSKPAEFPENSSLDNEIQFLKMNGFKFSIRDFHLMMMNIRYNNILQSKTEIKYNEKEVILDILDNFDMIDSTIIDGSIRQYLRELVENYDPQKMYLEEKNLLKNLKNHLAKANNRMYEEIVNFIDLYGNLNDKEFDKFQDYLLNVTNVENNSLINIIRFIKNSIYFNTMNLPAILSSSNNVFSNVPKHWGFSDKHNINLKQSIENQWVNIKCFKNNPLLTNVLKDVMFELGKLNCFMNHLPMQMPIEKDGNIFVSLFDTDTIHLLYVYFWFSTYYEYIDSTNKTENEKASIVNRKQKIRELITKNKDESQQTLCIGEIHDDEVEIDMINKEDIQKDVGKLLIAFYNIESKSRYVLSSYELIQKNTRKLKNIEKKKITDDLGNMDKFQRSLEDEMKKYKMGKWSVGIQKSLVYYDKDTYDKNADYIEAEAMMFNEGNDISYLGEDYMDGDPYGDENYEDY